VIALYKCRPILIILSHLRAGENKSLKAPPWKYEWSIVQFFIQRRRQRGKWRRHALVGKSGSQPLNQLLWKQPECMLTKQSNNQPNKLNRNPYLVLPWNRWEVGQFSVFFWHPYAQKLSVSGDEALLPRPGATPLGPGGGSAPDSLYRLVLPALAIWSPYHHLCPPPVATWRVVATFIGRRSAQNNLHSVRY